MKKANFFMIGNQKSGTTAMYEFLKQHPDIFMTYIKEPFYFSTDLLKEQKEKEGKLPYYMSKKGYEELFDDWKSEKIGGEASATYLFSKDAAKNIYKYNPDAKILMILREPVSYLYSLHMQNTISNGEDQDFKTALALESNRTKGKDLPRLYTYKTYFYYSEWTKYTEHVQRYLKLFPKKNIKIIIFDDFKEDNKKVYNDVLEFLDLDQFTPKFKHHNVSKVVKYPKIKYFLEKNFDFAKKIMPKKIHGTLASTARKVLMKEQQREKLDPALRKELMKKYKPEVVKLSKLLKRDLVKFWKYDKI